jgi:thiol-disulfide isomerase/thioredoxin
MARIILVLLILFSSSCNRNDKTILLMRDIELKMDYESVIETKLAELDIIDITAFVKPSTIEKLHLKLARNIKANDKEGITMILLDINGNGLHNDYGVDMMALAPNNWDVLNADRFNRLNFLPINQNQVLLINNQYLTISEVTESEISLTPAQPTDDFITFPYYIPKLSRNSIDGEMLDFQGLTQQGRLIYFEFWGTWCKPCVAQIPDLKQLQNKYKDQLIIIGIDHDDELSKLKEFTAKVKMDWPQIQNDADINRSFGGVYLYPLGVLYNSDGKLIRYDISAKEIIAVLSKK